MVKDNLTMNLGIRQHQTSKEFCRFIRGDSGVSKLTLGLIINHFIDSLITYFNTIMLTTNLCLAECWKYKDM